MTDRIYADHAATTPVRNEVIAAMLPYFGTFGFNPSSQHAEGRAARAALDEARATVAGLLGARPREIVFTGGGSEADTLAIVGGARAARGRGRHVVTAATEHHAVLHAMDVLRDEGFAVTVLGVNSGGLVDPDAFGAALRPDTVLASIMLANNELGTLGPVAKLAGIARDRNVAFHCDAVQAPGRVPLDVGALGVDLLSLSAHKFYGPKGVGVLYVRSGTPLVPLVVGGGQEAGLRAGTENVAGIVGLARALALAVAELPAETARLVKLRERFEAGLAAAIPGLRINGLGAPRLPNVSSVAFRGIDAATFLVRLDLDGLAVSAGSACAAGSSEPSHVIAAIGAPRWAELGTLRFSFGKLTSEQDVERLVSMLPEAVRSVRVDPADLGTEQCGLVADRVEGRS
jgi:cysteine desulfurase